MINITASEIELVLPYMTTVAITKINTLFRYIESGGDDIDSKIYKIATNHKHESVGLEETFISLKEIIFDKLGVVHASVIKGMLLLNDEMLKKSVNELSADELRSILRSANGSEMLANRWKTIATWLAYCHAETTEFIDAEINISDKAKDRMKDICNKAYDQISSGTPDYELAVDHDECIARCIAAQR